MPIGMTWISCFSSTFLLFIHRLHKYILLLSFLFFVRQFKTPNIQFWIYVWYNGKYPSLNISFGEQPPPTQLHPIRLTNSNVIIFENLWSYILFSYPTDYNTKKNLWLYLCLLDPLAENGTTATTNYNRNVFTVVMR